MPEVNGVHYPYTKKGMADAAAARKKNGNGNGAKNVKKNGNGKKKK